MTAILGASDLRVETEDALRSVDFDGVVCRVTDPSSGLEIRSFTLGEWPCAVTHELRLEAHGLCWGHLAVMRSGADFARPEQVAVRHGAASLTFVLMRQTLRVPVGVLPADHIGVINLDEHGRVDSMNDHGRELLNVVDLPVSVRSGGMMLLPDENLGWLRAHGTVQHGSGRCCVTVTLQAARPLQVAPILLAARGATPRAVQVTLRVLRGMTSAEIAAELKISPHTVQDHLKPVFSALSVNSRRQLLSSLFPSLKPYDLC